MKGTKHSSHAFVLVELLVVLSILSVLASLAVPRSMVYVEKARSAACHAQRKKIEESLVLYLTEHKDAPLPSLTELVKGGYFKTEPICPSGGVYLWVVLQSPDRYGLACSIHAYPVETVPSSGVIFQSEFLTMENLHVLRGKWDVADGRLRPTGAVKLEHRIAFGDTAWQDYEMSTSVTLGGGEGYGIFYRADGKQNVTGYAFQYEPTQRPPVFVVKKFTNGLESKPIASKEMSPGFPVYHQTHRITVAVQGDRHSIKVDGVEVLNFRDAEFSQGSAGFRNWGGSGLTFENLVVTELR